MFSEKFMLIAFFFRPRCGFGFFRKSNFCAIRFNHFFFLGQFPTVPLALLAEKRHSRLLRIAVRAGGFLGVLQEISQRVVLRDTENIVFLRFPQGRFSLK